MKNYTVRNFLEMLKYTAFAHVATAMLYIAIFSSAEQSYVSSGKTETYNTILLIISLASFAVSGVVMLAAHYANSEKKMNYLNATYEGGNKTKLAVITALKESATLAIANLIFQLPMVILFINFGYRYNESTIFETLYIADIGVYLALGNAFFGALLISLAWFAVYFLGVFIFVAPIWNMGRIRKKGAPIKPEENPKDAYHRYTFKNTFKFFHALRKFTVSYLTALGIILALIVIVDAFANEFGAKASYILFGIIYVLVFYKTHGHRRDASYYPHEKKFSLKKEITAVWHEELVYYLFIFVPLAIVCEISCFAVTGTNYITLALAPVFPFYRFISVPVLRSLINLVWASAAALLCITLKSAKQHRRVSRASKYRR